MTLRDIESNDKTRADSARELELGEVTNNGSSSAPASAQPQEESRTVVRRKQFAVSTRWERDRAEGRSGRNKMKACNNTCCCCAKPLGGMHVLWERRSDGSPIIIAGPLWPFCMFVTVPLIVFISGVFVYFVLLNDKIGLPWWIQCIYYPMIAITLISLFFTSCRNPGLAERVTDEEAGRSGWFWNEQVGSFRPPGTMYCRECKVLIEGYDHLCPWTGTGIGRGNMTAFKFFVTSVNLLCYGTVGLACAAFLLF